MVEKLNRNFDSISIDVKKIAREMDSNIDEHNIIVLFFFFVIAYHSTLRDAQTAYTRLIAKTPQSIHFIRHLVNAGGKQFV